MARSMDATSTVSLDLEHVLAAVPPLVERRLRDQLAKVEHSALSEDAQGMERESQVFLRMIGHAFEGHPDPMLRRLSNAADPARCMRWREARCGARYVCADRPETPCEVCDG